MRGKCIAPIFHPFNVVFLNKFLHFIAFYDRTKKSVVPLKPTMTVFKNKRRRLKCQTVNSCPRVILKPKMTFFKKNVIVCRRVFFPNVMEAVFCSSDISATPWDAKGSMTYVPPPLSISIMPHDVEGSMTGPPSPCVNGLMNWRT